MTSAPSARPEAAGVEEGWQRIHAVVAGLLGSVFVALVAFASTGVRGSDQYWYVADVEMIARGLPSTSNDTFAVAVLGGQGTPFVHDSLAMYLCVPATLAFGPFLGWVVTNTLATLCAASAIGFVVWRLARSPSVSVLAGAAYLFLPITLWQTTQPLVEAIIGMFVAVAIAILVGAERRLVGLSALAVVVGLAYWCRVSFSPLLALVPLLALADRERSLAERGLAALVTAGLVALFFVARPLLFHEAMPSSLGAVLGNQLGTGSNMDFLLYLDLPAPTPAAVFRKMLVAWKTQLGGASSAQLFYLPFNALAGFTVAQAARRGTFSGPRTLALAGVLLLVLHLITISLHQNQFRYLLVPLPALLATFFVALAPGIARALRRNAMIAALAGVGGLTLAIDLALAKRLHDEGAQEARQSAQLAATLRDHVATNDALVLCSGKDVMQMFAYAARPHTVLEVFETYPTEVYVDLAERVQAGWLACPRASAAAAAYGVQGRPAEVEALPAPFQAFSLFRIAPAPASAPAGG